jgi:GT2 family glycosyltransferase
MNTLQSFSYIIEGIVKALKILFQQGPWFLLNRIKYKLKQRNQYKHYLKYLEKIDDNEKIKKNKVKAFQYTPKISIIVPIYNTHKKLLRLSIESVVNQIYENWELCIADGASTKSYIKEILKKYSEQDSRIKVKFLSENKGIIGNSNEAISLATGEFLGFLDHDDELEPSALYEIIKLLNKNQDIDFIYSDEDKISLKGKRFAPHFKPNWSPDTLRSYNYITHFAVIRKKVIEDVGFFREGYEGAQDYDLFLRVVEKTQKIAHIPKVLYHWRAYESSVAGNPKVKMYAYESGKNALKEHIQRVGLNGEVHNGIFLGSYRIRYTICEFPQVSIIIPNRDKVNILKRCINSILDKSSYRNYVIFIIDNQSKDEETFKYYHELKDEPKIKVLKYNKPFNFSAINNFAVSKVNSEYLIFLNNDTEIISPEWIQAMLEFAQRRDVGAVGALLYYPNNTIQHAGVIVGIGGFAGHPHRHFHKDSLGYMGRAKVCQNMSAVTGACLMTKKQVFKEVGGFDENYSHALNDIDFCLKIRERGYLIVYTPYAELYHYESLSRGYEDTKEKQKRFKKEIIYFQKKWKDILDNGDPYYNPNLTLNREDFSIRI